MGNVQKPISEFLVLKPITPQERFEVIGKGNGFDLVRVAQLGQSSPVYEQYMVSKNPGLSEQDDIQIYEVRNGDRTQFVRVVRVQKTSMKDPSGALLTRVITERIPVRLADLKSLTFEQALYILQSALAAYRAIVRSSKPVFLTQRMIGVNHQGEVKVWINQNFSLNAPQFQEKPISEAEMAELVFNLVGSHLPNGTYPAAFKSAYNQTPHNFEALIGFISSFIRDNKMKVPQKLNLIPQSGKPVLSIPSPAQSNHPLLSQKTPNSQSTIAIQSVNRSLNLANQQSQTFIRPQPQFAPPAPRLTTPNNPKARFQPSTPMHAILKNQSNIIDNRPLNSLSAVNLNQRPGVQILHPVVNLGSAARPVASHRLPNGSVVESMISAPNRASINSRPGTIQTEILRNPSVVHQSIVMQVGAPMNLPVFVRQVEQQAPIVVEQRNFERYEYPRRNFVDLSNAKLVAYDEAQVIGHRERPDLSRQVLFVPSETEIAVGVVEKRETVPIRTQRAKSQLIKSMVSNPRTPRRRGNMTLFESRHRELRGQPIMHQSYHEFMNRVQKGERPKSTLVRLSYAGRPGPTIQQRPAVFAAEKIVTSQTTVEKSPKKKYMSADPMSVHNFKSTLQERSKRSIKLPIKKQVNITGYERICFEQDLEPIIKQPVQPKRQVVVQPKRQTFIRRSPGKQVIVEETPIKAMTTSVFSAVKPSPHISIPNPQRIVQNNINQVAAGNIKFNLVSPTNIKSVLVEQPSPKFYQAVPQVQVQQQFVQQVPGNISQKVVVTPIAVVQTKTVVEEINHQVQAQIPPRVVQAQFRKATPANTESTINPPPTHSDFAPRYANSMTSSSDDYSSLRPQTLFQPKPEQQQYVEYEPMYQPAEPIAGNYYGVSQTIENRGNGVSVEKQQYYYEEQHYQSYRREVASEEEEVYYHHGTQQVGIDYNKKDYEPVQYGAVEVIDNLAQPTADIEELLKDPELEIPTGLPSRSQSSVVPRIVIEQPGIGHRRLATHITEESDNIDEVDSKINNLPEQVLSRLSDIKMTNSVISMRQRAILEQNKLVLLHRCQSPRIPFLPTYGVSQALDSCDRSLPLGYVPYPIVSRYTPIVCDKHGLVSEATSQDSGHFEEELHHRYPFTFGNLNEILHRFKLPQVNIEIASQVPKTQESRTDREWESDDYYRLRSISERNWVPKY